MGKIKYQDRFIKEKVLSIDYRELDDLIQDAYNLEYGCFESALDQSNDSILRFAVDGIFTSYEQEDLEEFLKTRSQEYNTVRLLLNDLCRNEKIEPGIYLINISW